MRTVLIAALVVVALIVGVELFPVARERVTAFLHPPAPAAAPRIPVEDIVSGEVPKDGIPALTNPKFVSVAEADEYLDDQKAGILVLTGQTARYYPFQILVWHELVNDSIEGVPVLISFSPLTWSPVVFERSIRGGPVEFGVSGKLYNSNLLMYNRAGPETLWTQYDGRAVVGPLAGEELRIIPSVDIPWRAVKERYPHAQVLSTETGYVRNYRRDPYGDYYTSREILFAVRGGDERLHPKERVIGFDFDGSAKAYAVRGLAGVHFVTDEIAGRPIVITHDPATEAVRAFSRNIGGQVLTLDFSPEPASMIDRETGTRWSLEGVGLEGAFAGRTLDPAPFVEMFWFAWAAAHPDTELGR